MLPLLRELGHMKRSCPKLVEGTASAAARQAKDTCEVSDDERLSEVANTCTTVNLPRVYEDLK